MQSSPPSLSELEDAEDRAYAAQALKFVSGDWVTSYLAQSIVEEETGEKARSELISALLGKTIDLSNAFESLSIPLSEWKPETEAPGDSVARRLKRILSVARPELLVADVPMGDDVGGSFERLVFRAFQNVGPPTSSFDSPIG